MDVSWAQVAALRMERQNLTTRAPRAALLDVVRRHVAIQAQVMSSAELALSTRVDGISAHDVREALWTQRTLVKTWAMRGTLHLVAADELPELVGGLATRINWLRPVWLRYFQVTEAQMRALQDAIGETLSAEPMTRLALADALARRLGDETFAQRVLSGWGTFLKPAAGRGLLCFGPGDGRNVTFVDPRAWLGRPMPEPSEEAVAAVIARHLHAFPGSSRSELARWWGVQGGSPLRRPIASLGDRVAEMRIEGTKALALADDVERLREVGPSLDIRLLAGFDPYTLSLQKEAEPLLPLARRPLVSREAGWISAVVVAGGAVVGTWSHERKRAELRLRIRSWRNLSAAERVSIDAEADRIGRFLDAVPVVAIDAPA